jgi:hypothetical protein
MPDALTLTCSACSFVNESERVYCRNCGAKLDRSVLPRPEEAKVRESMARTRREFKKRTNPGGGAWIKVPKTAFHVCVWAALVALLVQVFRPPQGVPAANAESSSRMLATEIAAIQSSPVAKQLVVTEQDANTYLRTLKTKIAPGFISGVAFSRAFVNFEPGTCRLGVEQSFWGRSVYYSITYFLETRDGRFMATPISASVGRVSIHPRLLQGAEFAFKGLSQALSRERDFMSKMQAVTVEKGRILLVTRGR